MRETRPVLFEDTAPTDDFWRQLADWRGPDERAADDAIYGDFPAGPAMLWAIQQGQAGPLIEEASIRLDGWRRMQDQAVVFAISEKKATYAQVGQWLGLSAAGAHKRYSGLVAQAVEIAH